MTERVTMSQVAQAAGVNKATVSRALRGDSRISPATHRKVWEAARLLGYEPNALASGLSSRRSGVAALVVPAFRRPWVGSLITGVTRVLSRGRMDLLVWETDGGQASTAQALRRLSARQVDGLLWFGGQLPPKQGDLPLISIDGSIEDAVQCSLQLAQEEIKTEVKSLVKGRSIVYRSGPEACFPFLSQLDGGISPADFVIWDGLLAPRDDESPDLACTAPGGWDWGAPWRLEYPAMECGVLAARVLLNELSGRGARPREILIRARPTMGLTLLEKRVDQ